jgi:hypothetical protein
MTLSAFISFLETDKGGFLLPLGSRFGAAAEQLLARLAWLRLAGLVTGAGCPGPEVIRRAPQAGALQETVLQFC